MRFTDVRTLSGASGASKKRTVARWYGVDPSAELPRVLACRAFLSQREWFGAGATGGRLRLAPADLEEFLKGEPDEANTASPRAKLRAQKPLWRNPSLRRTPSMAATAPSAPRSPDGAPSCAGPIVGSTRRTCYPEEHPLGCAFCLLVRLSACRQRGRMRTCERRPDAHSHRLT
jgi:hypothetical protein